MTKTIANEVTAEPTVHPLLKSHMFVSKKHINLEDLSAFEATSMSLVLVLAVLAGVAFQINVF